jgi:hypothetical protein
MTAVITFENCYITFTFQTPLKTEYMNYQVESKGFWRWCTALRIAGVMDLSIVRNSKYQEKNIVLETGPVF